MSPRTDSRRVALSDINITPVVDVTLVLLIIFMVAAPMMREGIRVTLPAAVTSRQVEGSGVVISLTKEHMVYLDEEVITMKELRRKLSHLDRSEKVLIQADRHAYVNKLMELWDLCRDVGLSEIHIATLSE